MSATLGDRRSTFRCTRDGRLRVAEGAAYVWGARVKAVRPQRSRARLPRGCALISRLSTMDMWTGGLCRGLMAWRFIPRNSSSRAFNYVQGQGKGAKNRSFVANARRLRMDGSQRVVLPSNLNDTSLSNADRQRLLLTVHQHSEG